LRRRRWCTGAPLCQSGLQIEPALSLNRSEEIVAALRLLWIIPIRRVFKTERDLSVVLVMICVPQEEQSVDAIDGTLRDLFDIFLPQVGVAGFSTAGRARTSRMEILNRTVSNS